MIYTYTAMQPVSSWWLSLQHDWTDGFANQEKVWVSAHHSDRKTGHSFLTSDGPADGDFRSQVIIPKQMRVTHVESGFTTNFTSPTHAHKITPNSSLVALDISSLGAIGAASSGSDILVFETKVGIVRRKMTGHLAGVQVLKFFPSNTVLLSGGSDMCLKIWSVEDGSCPVTIPAHKRLISSLAIVERGRNVVSSSHDGTIKLWCCGTQQNISTLSLERGPVNHITLLPDQGGSPDALVLSASDSGSLSLHSLEDSSQIARYEHTSALTACSHVQEYCVMAGSADGELITLDLRMMSEPLSSHKRSNYAISSLYKDVSHDRLWCAQRDGECYTVSTNSDSLTCDVTLSGGDCEPVLGVVAKGGVVLTTAKDRIIRRYDIVAPS